MIMETMVESKYDEVVLLNFCYLFIGVLNTSKVLTEECKINPHSNVISKYYTEKG
ncbi:MAG: hypothetical protein Q7J35_03835 [Candidatus Methanoperedens sp.]|nr:hypothetical protein [Candidatus Methanoperedens sp.]